MLDLMSGTDCRMGVCVELLNSTGGGAGIKKPGRFYRGTSGTSSSNVMDRTIVPLVRDGKPREQ